MIFKLDKKKHITREEFQKFIDRVGASTEYISGKKYHKHYKGKMIAVIEWNEMIAIAKDSLGLQIETSDSAV